MVFDPIVKLGGESLRVGAIRSMTQGGTVIVLRYYGESMLKLKLGRLKPGLNRRSTRKTRKLVFSS